MKRWLPSVLAGFLMAGGLTVQGADVGKRYTSGWADSLLWKQSRAVLSIEFLWITGSTNGSLMLPRVLRTPMPTRPNWRFSLRQLRRPL